MNNASTAPMSDLPEMFEPDLRIMRVAGTHQDALLDWSPRIFQLYTLPFDKYTTTPAGSAHAILRRGYEAHPLGIATNMYRPVDHRVTAHEVTRLTTGKCAPEGAIVDGHGYHVVHAFKVLTPVTELVGEMPLISRLNLIHDHTGAGALRASVVTYLGQGIVLGSKNFTRRIHVGAGEQDVGVGDMSRWLGVLDAMIETASLQQGSIAQLVRAADAMAMTEEMADVFKAAEIPVARTKDPGKAIIPATPLDVVVAYHKQRKGQLSWGVWSRRLEGDALVCLEKITGIELPKQLFNRW